MAGDDKKSASERYQKISQLEHILKRPDTYIGSVEVQESQQWIYDESIDCMVEKPVNIVPGLFKIFDEILVNAADNKVRDPSMKRIDVNIMPEENTIEVRNDGKGIPIEIHDKEKIYIPELIFGHLLTSSNYDDNERKVTGGRNGYGAKLCNIFSTEFILETADPKSGQKYIQRWENNMNVCHPPTITSYKKGTSYTKVTFKPDLSRFGMEKLDDDILGVMRRRVYDINGSVRDVSVYLNGKYLKIKNFKSYVELYLKSLEKKRQLDKMQISDNNNNNKATEVAAPSNIPTILYERINDRWEVAFAVSDISFQQISFVNSIATTSGGTHVNYVVDQIVRKVNEILKKKKKKY
ncbi:DNA topoisomerase 2 PWA37_003462 [Arxiozyma heterogenica]|uniref:DNA topoisomerase 2 n=1 Tax=Arxiozyma heterogenica TaxID=278026 RepID=UPI002EE31433